MRLEHALPVSLFYVGTVIGSRHGLGGPFLLEEGLVTDERSGEARQVVEVVLVP